MDTQPFSIYYDFLVEYKVTLRIIYFKYLKTEALHVFINIQQDQLSDSENDIVSSVKKMALGRA